MKQDKLYYTKIGDNLLIKVGRSRWRLAGLPTVYCHLLKKRILWPFKGYIPVSGRMKLFFIENSTRPTAGKITIKILPFLFFAFITIAAQSQLSVTGYVRDMQSTYFFHPDSVWQISNQIHNRLNFKYSPDTCLTFAAEIRTRLLWASGGLTPGQEKDAGIVNASQKVFSNRSALLLVRPDRFYAEWNRGNWIVTIGRQRINWSQAFVWAPNDIFNSYTWFDFDYDERQGCDAARFQYYTGPSSRIDLAVKGDSAGKITAGGLYAFSVGGYDIQVLGGYFAGSDIVTGAGFSGTLGKGSLRGEFSYFHPAVNLADTGGIALLSLGYDILFENSLMLQGEILYNGNHKPDVLEPGRIIFVVPSAKNLFVPGISVFASASYPLTPLINSSFSLMAMPEYKTFFSGASFSFSLSDNSSLMFTSYFFTELKEFNGYNRLYMFFLRYGYSF